MQQIRNRNNRTYVYNILNQHRKWGQQPGRSWCGGVREGGFMWGTRLELDSDREKENFVRVKLIHTFSEHIYTQREWNFWLVVKTTFRFNYIIYIYLYICICLILCFAIAKPFLVHVKTIIIYWFYFYIVRYFLWHHFCIILIKILYYSVRCSIFRWI